MSLLAEVISHGRSLNSRGASAGAAPALSRLPGVQPVEHANRRDVSLPLLRKAPHQRCSGYGCADLDWLGDLKNGRSRHRWQVNQLKQDGCPRALPIGDRALFKRYALMRMYAVGRLVRASGQPIRTRVQEQ